MGLKIYKYTEFQLLQLLMREGTVQEMGPFPHQSISVTSLNDADENVISLCSKN
jgi:hypothetical protein